MGRIRLDQYRVAELLMKLLDYLGLAVEQVPRTDNLPPDFRIVKDGEPKA